MKHGFLFFALSLFCFIGLLALCFVSITDTITNYDFQRPGVEHANEYESDVTVFGMKVDLVDIVFLILIYAFAAFIPTFIKFAAAGLRKRRLAIASCVFDVMFATAGAIVAVDIFIDGIPLNPLTAWALAATFLPILSFVFNLMGLKRQKEGL